MASSVVISQRLTRMALAGAHPSARDRREFHRMGQEKLDAAAESSIAVAMALAWMGPRTAASVFQQWMTSTSGLLAMCTRPPISVATIQTALLRAALAGNASLASHGARTMTDLVHQGLRPVHARATANARRLGKR